MNKMLSKMEIVTDNLSGESTDNPLKSEDIISRLETVFAHIYEKDSSFASMISETGELLIEDICKAPSVIEITADINTIKTAIFGSKVLRVISDIKVKSATAKPDQNTLILRDIATSTDSNEILKLFSNTISSDGSPCPVVQSIRSDMNDTWFVTFHSETDAKKALFSIREAKFEGKPIRVRLKTESTVKSFYSGTTRDPQSQQQTAGNRPDKDGFSSSPKENMNNNNSTLRSVSYSPSAVPTTPFFGAYPVPPPMQQHHPSVPGQQSQAGGPPSAYATMVLGPDGKPLYPGMPDTAAAAMASSQQVQLMLAAQQQHQQAYMDMLHNQQQQQQQQQHRHGGYGGYNNNRYRYGRNQNSGYNSNQNMNGGYAQRSPNYRNNRTTGPRSYFAGNNNQQSHQMPPPAVATTATSGVGVNISETATAENEETSNSTAGSSSNSNTESAAATTTVERSSPDTATAVPGTEGQQGPGAAASDTTNNPPTGPSSTTSKRFAPPSNAMRPQGAPPMMGMGGPQLPPHMANQGFMNFMPPGAAQHFFPNYPYPGIPFNYNPGLAPNGPGMIPHMGQMGPGAFPPPMGMGYYPGHPPGHVGGGYRHRNTGQLPRRASEGDVRAGTQQQYKGTTQPPEFNQNGAVMHRTAANRSVTSGSLESDTSAALPPPPVNTPAALSLEERKVHNNQTTSNSYNNSNSSNTNNNYKNYRDKKILSATETTAGGEKNPHEKRNNSRKTSTENTTTGSKYSGSSTVETGGEQLSNISTGDNSSNKNIVRKYHSNANTTNNTTTINNTTEKKKMNNRDKDNKTRTANIGKTEASVNVKPSAEFNMESDFPTLMVMDSAEKSSDTATSTTTTSTSAMPLKTAFADYATAARKASSHIEPSTVSAAAVAAVASSPASSSSTNPVAAVSVEAPKDSSKAASGRKTERDDAVAMKGVAQRQQLEQPCGTSPASPVVHSKPLKGGAKHLEVASIGEHVPAATTVRTTTNNESSVGVESFTFGSVVAPVVESAERQVFHFGSHGKPVGAKAPVVAAVEKQQKVQTDSIAAGPAVSGVSTGNPIKTTTAGGPSVPPSSAAAVVAKPTPAAPVSSKKSEPATSVVMPAAAPMIDRSAWPVPSSSRTVPVPSNPSPSLMASSRSSNSTATSSTPPVVENSTATAAGSAWGSKKSFLDVVRPHEKA